MGTLLYDDCTEVKDASPRRRCKAAIYVRDTYRRTGRGRTGFEMHYRKQQCSRAAVKDGRCKQHCVENFPNVELLDWNEFVERERRG